MLNTNNLPVFDEHTKQKLLNILFNDFINQIQKYKNSVPQLIVTSANEKDSFAWANYNLKKNIIEFDSSIDFTKIINMKRDYKKYCSDYCSTNIGITEKEFALEVTLLHELGHWKQSVDFNIDPNRQMTDYLPERLLEYHNIIIHENKYMGRQRKSYCDIKQFILYLHVVIKKDKKEKKKAIEVLQLFYSMRKMNKKQLCYSLGSISLNMLIKYGYAKKAMDEILNKSFDYDNYTCKHILGNLLFELALAGNIDAIKNIMNYKYFNEEA